MSAVVVCAANVQANTVPFFFAAFSNAPGVKGVDEGFPVLCDAPQTGIPISPPPLCRDAPAVHRMRGLSGELQCQWLCSVNFFFLSRTAVLNFPVFAVIFEQAFWFFVWFFFFGGERLGKGVGWREDTYI